MKKTVTSIVALCATALVALLIAIPAHAASLWVSPTSVKVTKGESVTLTLSVNPDGATISAVKANLTYPQNLLTPVSFSFANSWMPVTQTGYSDMGNGTIVKSAGYPGGFATTTTFGTVVFTAIADGTAHVSVVAPTAIYDGSAVNRLTGTQGSAVITIAEATPSTPTTPNGSGTATTTASTTPTGNSSTTGGTVTTAGSNSGANTTVQKGSTNTTNAVAIVAPTSASSSSSTNPNLDLTAAVANASSTNAFAHSKWPWIVIIVIILLIIIMRIIRARRNRDGGSSAGGADIDAEIYNASMDTSSHDMNNKGNGGNQNQSSGNNNNEKSFH